MMHFEIAHWVDFAREMASEENRKAMEAHLAGGCSECRDTVHFCQKLSATCRVMTEYEVPETVLRLARAIFPTQTPQGKRLLRVPVELMFDSFLAPEPVGVRSTWQVGWQALYRAGDCSVDLRVEPDRSSSRAAIIGQISNHVVPELEMSNLPVCLKQGKLVLAESRSNQFGEFQMEYEQQPRVQLCIYLEGGTKSIQVPLKRLVPDKRPVGRSKGTSPIGPGPIRD
ncbi:MAG TPA: hypothetical protein VKU19_15850 [Bryobacteraceae bacterium]|nr:hypothetical protein [Bryobacteraceae bacterium]